MKFHWTQPYYGVQHLNGLEHQHVQLTVEDHGKFAIAYQLNLHGHSPFTPVWEHRFDSVGQARAEAEQRAKAFT